MTEKIEPALTAEEWAERFGFLESYTPPARPHARAAVYLYGQPFGFIWEDVDAVNASREQWAAMGAPWVADHLSRIADRIAALLPPREHPKTEAV